MRTLQRFLLTFRPLVSCFSYAQAPATGIYPFSSQDNFGFWLTFGEELGAGVDIDG